MNINIQKKQSSNMFKSQFIFGLNLHHVTFILFINKCYMVADDDFSRHLYRDWILTIQRLIQIV